MTELRVWMSLFAAIGHLSLAVTTLLAAGRSPMKRPVALLCISLFGWNFATFARNVLRVNAFAVSDSFFTALSPPLVLEVVLAFVGEGRRHRPARVGSWFVLGSLSVASLGGLVSPAMFEWLDAPSWMAIFLLGWAPTVGFELVLLWHHLRSTTDLAEKARTRTVLAALVIGALFSFSDVIRDLGLPAPYLGALGTLIATALLMTCAVRLELFERNVSSRTTVYVATLAIAAVGTYFVVFRTLRGSIAIQVFATAMVTLVLVVVAYELVASASESRDRSQRLLVLGRFSAQMAHDIKSPLTALLGAVQVLEETKSEETKARLLEVVSEQAKRVVAIVDRYDRMGRIEPRKTLVRVDSMVKSIAKAHGIDRVRAGAPELECDADAELLASAVENVVRNALEASKGPSDVEVVTEVSERGVVVRVIDAGSGMDARQRDRAFDDFFTTKSGGSGLGLTFARRVLLAHGGDVELESELGRGTTVTLKLPRG